MKELSALEIINKIRKKEQLNAVVKGGFMQIKITTYSPIIAIAMHGGSRVEREFVDILKPDYNEREISEESFTDFYINRLPIQLIMRDIKVLYDIEKPKSECINVENLKKPLTSFQEKKLLKNYDTFYVILKEIIDVLSKGERRVHLYDVHSTQQEQLITLQVPNHSALAITNDLIKSFENIDATLINKGINVIEEKNEFIKKLAISHKKLSYLRIYVNELYKGSGRNNYYIPMINRIRFMLTNGILEQHVEKVKEKNIRDNDE